MLPGDFLTSPPLVRNRSSKTCIRTKLSQHGREHAVPEQALEPTGKQGERGGRVEIRGLGLMSQQKHCEVVLLSARCFTFSFLLRWLWVPSLQSLFFL